MKKHISIRQIKNSVKSIEKKATFDNEAALKAEHTLYAETLEAIAFGVGLGDPRTMAFEALRTQTIPMRRNNHG